MPYISAKRSATASRPARTISTGVVGLGQAEDRRPGVRRVAWPALAGDERQNGQAVAVGGHLVQVCAQVSASAGSRSVSLSQANRLPPFESAQPSTKRFSSIR